MHLIIACKITLEEQKTAFCFRKFLLTQNIIATDSYSETCAEFSTVSSDSDVI